MCRRAKRQLLNMKDILIVAATRMAQSEFEMSSKLGVSLRQLAFDPQMSTSIVFENDGKNVRGLGTIYNTFLTPAYARYVVLFVHDDVYIHDTFVRYRLNEAITRFDVVGLAGNKSPDLSQPSWALKFNEDGTYAGWQDKVNLSGAVAHTADGGAVSFFGEMPADCELLDGLFLAVNTEKLLQANVKFDPQFQFHFYDLDFCRACRQTRTFPRNVAHSGHPCKCRNFWLTTMAGGKIAVQGEMAVITLAGPRYLASQSLAL